MAGEGSVREISYAEALAEGLREVLAADARVHLIGSAFFGLTQHRALMARVRGEFPDRITDPPIAELGFCGLAIGAALAGLRPVVDLGTASFVFQAWPQIVNEAASARYMGGGQHAVPVVFHLLHGIRGGGAAQHSHSPQAMFWNSPGLEIVLPATPADAKGLLKTAVASDNPTIFVSHPRLFDVKGPVPDGDGHVPFGRAVVRRPGRDVTIVATSLMVQRSLAAADLLSGEGIDVEVVDPRTLVPLDREAILGSVGRTGRLVVVDECHLSCGVAAEIAALAAQHAFGHLRAPVVRVATADVPIPFSRPLEEFVEPTAEKIVAAVREALGTSRPAKRAGRRGRPRGAGR